MTFLEWLYSNNYEHESDEFIEGARVAYEALQEELEVMDKKIVSLECILDYIGEGNA